MSDTAHFAQMPPTVELTSNGGARDTAGNEAGEAPPTRRALVAVAVGGINRFKQSWVSIMILKASIGLGQVTVLIVLLALSHALSSPLYSRQKQATPSPTCPRPQLYVAWMAVQIVRLTVCWFVSCWMCIRAQRADARRQTSGRSSSRGEEDAADIRSQEPGISQSPRITLMSTDDIPSLSHSSSSGSSTTVANMSSAGSSLPVSPSTIYNSTMGSSGSLDALATYAMNEKPDTSHQRLNSAASGLDSIASATQEDLSRSVHEYHQARIPQGQQSSAARENLRAARAMHQGRSEEENEEVERASGFAGVLDRCALPMQKALGAISSVLFVLGNVLVFYPNPAKNDTCYHSAPMLWWGVMTVTGVGWFLLLQLFVVVFVVGLGGQAIIVLLRRVGVIPPPPAPEAPRAPQSEVLTPEELSRLKLVVYLPDPNESPADTPSTVVATPSDEGKSEGILDVTNPPTVSRRSIDRSRLAYPPVYLTLHHATCVICQENYVEPREAKTILLKAEPLRQLGCGHIFHTNCIDEWLLKGSGNCPFCNRSVRETLAATTEKDSSETESRSVMGTKRFGFLKRSGPSLSQA